MNLVEMYPFRDFNSFQGRYNIIPTITTESGLIHLSLTLNSGRPNESYFDYKNMHDFVFMNKMQFRNFVSNTVNTWNFIISTESIDYLRFKNTSIVNTLCIKLVEERYARERIRVGLSKSK